MKQTSLLLFALILVLSCNSEKEETKSEDLPELPKVSDIQDESVGIIENFSSDGTNKRTLFVFPHADDETVCAGTILKLKEQGYQVGVCILTDQGGETRSEEMLKSMEILKVDFYKQIPLEVTKYQSWDAIMKNEITDWRGDSSTIIDTIVSLIHEFSPGIIFTWDNEIGGYGHPDHLVVGEMVNHIFDNQEAYLDSSEWIEKLYMVSLSKGLEDYILREFDWYEDLIARYNKTQIPAPNVAVQITKYAEEKKADLLVYKSEYRSALSKFYPGFKETDANQYFSVYDREYYLVKSM